MMAHYGDYSVEMKETDNEGEWYCEFPSSEGIIGVFYFPHDEERSFVQIGSKGHWMESDYYSIEIVDDDGDSYFAAFNFGHGKNSLPPASRRTVPQ